jgi:hypothetical protein
MPDNDPINSNQLKFQTDMRVLTSQTCSLSLHPKPLHLTDLDSFILTATRKSQSPTGLVFHNIDNTSNISVDTAIIISGVLANELVAIHRNNTLHYNFATRITVK